MQRQPTEVHRVNRWVTLPAVSPASCKGPGLRQVDRTICEVVGLAG